MTRYAVPKAIFLYLTAFSLAGIPVYSQEDPGSKLKLDPVTGRMVTDGGQNDPGHTALKDTFDGSNNAPGAKTPVSYQEEEDTSYLPSFQKEKEKSQAEVKKAEDSKKKEEGGSFWDILAAPFKWILGSKLIYTMGIGAVIGGVLGGLSGALTGAGVGLLIGLVFWMLLKLVE